MRYKHNTLPQTSGEKYKLRALWIAVIGALFVMSVHAQPKYKGCTTADLNSPKAAACMKQQEKDVMAGRVMNHYLVCHDDGLMQCCKPTKDGGFVCNTVKIKARPVHGTTVVKPTGVLDPAKKSGGVVPLAPVKK